MAVNNEISKAFNQCASEYELAATVQQEIGRRLFERLHYLKITPQRILDLGCGPGFFSKALASFYPKAQIYGLDIAQAMLIQAKKKQKWWSSKWFLTVADMKNLPFATGSFDLVFANQAIHWGGTSSQVFRELNRVMNVNGCLMFTTLGPDTFKELKSSWAGINKYAHSNEFADMHDVGDSLLQERFLDPVMDMELITVLYETLPNLLSSLKKQGVRNINPLRNPGLTGKQAWSQFEKNYQNLHRQGDKYALTYEVVYGHAWKGVQSITPSGREEVFIPISQIQRSKQGNFSL